MSDEELKQQVIAAAKTSAMKFSYYDRKEDEDLSVEQLADAIKRGVISTDEIAGIFRRELEGSANNF